MHPYKPAEIYKGKTEWYIEYYYQNPDDHTIYDRFKLRKGLNTAKIKKKPAERYALARAKQIAMNNLLAAGFNPHEEFTFASVKKPKDAENNILTALTFALEIKMQKSKKKRTHQSYSSATNQFKNWLEDNEYSTRSANEIDQGIIQEYCDYLLLEKKLANKSYNGLLSYISALFGELKTRKIVEVNPCIGIGRLHTEKGKKNIPMTDEEYKLLTKELPKLHKRLYLINGFVYYAYIRIQETCDLRREQLDFENKIIHVHSGSTKNSSTIALQMHEKLYKLLMSNKVHLLQPKQYIFSEKDTLLPGTHPVHRNRVSDLWKEIVKEGLKIDKDMYASRHLSAKRFILNGGKIKHLQLLMRHHSITVTEEYISSLVPEDFGKIEDRIK